MKSLIFSHGYNNFAVNIWLLVIRVAVGVLMLTHAESKFNMLFSGEEIAFIDPIGVGHKLSLILVVFAEFFCSIFLIVGFATRLASIPLIFTMFVAAFIFHLNDPFAAKELGILYMVIYVNILILGPGKFSLDWFLAK